MLIKRGKRLRFGAEYKNNIQKDAINRKGKSMQLQDQNILFLTRTMAIGGTENVILQLCEVFKPLVKKIVVCSSGGVNEIKLQKLGIKHYKISDIENKSVSNILTVRATIKRIILDEKITVIHTHHRMAAFYIQLIRVKRFVKLINTSHTAFYDKRVLTHIAFKDFNLIACGEGVKRSLVNGLNFDPSRITVICNGVKKDKGTRVLISYIENAKKEGKKVFAVIGRLSKEKGIDYLIKAIPLLKTEKICCIIVGNGPEEEKLKKLAVDMGVSENTVFLGFRGDIANIISQLDFVVQPSLQEGLPLVPIEAFSEGKTIVGTEVDGTSEIVINNENGLLVPSGNEKELAKAIDFMCNTDRERFERQAIKTYENKYSFEVFRNGYIEYYKAI